MNWAEATYNFHTPVFPMNLWRPTVSNAFTDDTLLIHVPTLAPEYKSSAILLQTTHTTILVDISGDMGTEYLLNYLDKVGVDEIDLLVLTHPHEDHIGGPSTRNVSPHNPRGLEQFLNRFTIHRIWCNGVNPGVDPEGNYDALLDQIFPAGYTTGNPEDIPKVQGNSIIPYHEPRPNNNENLYYTIGNLEIAVCNPPRILKNYIENDDSIVFQVKWGDLRILLSGDLTETGEARILSAIAQGLKPAEDIKANLLYLGHHSLQSGSDEWLDMVSPEIVTYQNTAKARLPFLNLKQKGIPEAVPVDAREDIVFHCTKDEILNLEKVKPVFV